MAKITLSNVSSGYNRQNINTNFEDIETDLQEKVLYRDNPDGEANQMENELDMNSNDIANAKDIYTSKLYLNGVEVTVLYSAPVDTDTSWFYEDDDGNLSLGSTALDSNTPNEGSDSPYGFNNTAIGYNALYSNTYGTNNIATGHQALASNTTGSYNTANGNNALYSNTTGSANTASGRNALYFNTTGGSSTAHGNSALRFNTTGNNNTATGSLALNSNTEGNNNTAYGSLALYDNTTGSNNTAAGYQALFSNTTGYSNTAYGYRALYSNTTGNNNVANGNQALFSNTIGSGNIASGSNALYFNTTGFDNTVSGRNALFSNTTGNRNTAHGYQALYDNTTGDNNTASGYYALTNNTTANYNTATGYNALSSNTTYNNTSGFGNDAQVTASDQVQLGNSGTTTYVYGTVQDRSDLRDKADVRDTILGLDFITALRPVDYRWDLRDDYKPDAPTEPEPLKDDATEQDIQAHELALSQYENDCAEWLIAVKHENLIHDGTHKRSRYHHGVIAQEVAEVIAESGIDFGGYQDHKVSGGEDVLSIGYDELIGPLIKALQEVNQKFDDYVKTHP